MKGGKGRKPLPGPVLFRVLSSRPDDGAGDRSPLEKLSLIALGRLSPFQRSVIGHRFGLEAAGPCSREELAARYGTTPVRIGTVEKNAGDVLRELLFSEGVGPSSHYPPAPRSPFGSSVYRELDGALESLAPEEEDLLRLFYRFGAERSLTLHDLADRFGTDLASAAEALERARRAAGPCALLWLTVFDGKGRD